MIRFHSGEQRHVLLEMHPSTHDLVLVGLNLAGLAHRLQHISVVLAALLACGDEGSSSGDGLGSWLGGCLGALGLEMGWVVGGGREPGIRCCNNLVSEMV